VAAGGMLIMLEQRIHDMMHGRRFSFDDQPLTICAHVIANGNSNLNQKLTRLEQELLVRSVTPCLCLSARLWWYQGCIRDRGHMKDCRWLDWLLVRLAGTKGRWTLVQGVRRDPPIQVSHPSR